MIEYGEDIDLQISVENIGNFNASAITVNVTSDDEYISMINGESMIAYAIMNEVATTEGPPVSFSISNSVPDNHIAQFQALLSNAAVKVEIKASFIILSECKSVLFMTGSFLATEKFSCRDI